MGNSVMKQLVVAALALLAVVHAGDDQAVLEARLKSLNTMTVSLQDKLAGEAKRAMDGRRVQTAADTALAKAAKERNVAAASLKSLNAEVKDMQAKSSEFITWRASTQTAVEKLTADQATILAENVVLKQRKVNITKNDAEVQAEIDTVKANIKAMEVKLEALPGLSGKSVQASNPALETETEDDLMNVIVKSQDQQGQDEADAKKKKETEAKVAAGIIAKAEAAKALAAKTNSPLPETVEARPEATGSMASNEMPCCVQHKGPGCLDRKVSQCVCLRRPGCCTGDWDTGCVEVMVDSGCAMCSADTLKATPLLDGTVQTGGRTTDQVNFGR